MHLASLGARFRRVRNGPAIITGPSRRIELGVELDNCAYLSQRKADQAGERAKRASLDEDESTRNESASEANLSQLVYGVVARLRWSSGRSSEIRLFFSFFFSFTLACS